MPPSPSAGRLPSFSISSPPLGQVQFPVQQDPTLGCGIGQKNSYLAIFNPPRSSTVLALYPHRLGPLLQETGLISYQYPVLLAQMLHDVVPQVIANQVGIPDVAGQQPFHPVGRGVAYLLCQLPPILALYRRKESLQIVQRRTAGFRTVKLSRYALPQCPWPPTPLSIPRPCPLPLLTFPLKLNQ